MSALDTLVENVVRGDPAAWQALVVEIESRIEAFTRGHSWMKSRGLSALPDHVAEVKLATLERLASDGFRNLTRYLDQRAKLAKPQEFGSWLYGAVDFEVKDHVRRRYGRSTPAPKSAAPTEPGSTNDAASGKGEQADAGGPKPARTPGGRRALDSLADGFEEGAFLRSLVSTLGVTSRLTLAQVLSHIAEKFAPDEQLALQLYYGEERNFEQIAERLGLPSSRDADKLIRKLNARLRYFFTEESEPT